VELLNRVIAGGKKKRRKPSINEASSMIKSKIMNTPAASDGVSNGKF